MCCVGGGCGSFWYAGDDSEIVVVMRFCCGDSAVWFVMVRLELWCGLVLAVVVVVAFVMMVALHPLFCR